MILVLVAVAVAVAVGLVALTPRGRRVGHWWAARPWLLLLVVITVVTALGGAKLDAEANERCHDNQDNRAVIRELVEVATASSGSSAGLSRLTELPEFDALSPEDQAYWRAFYAAVSAPRPANGQPTSTNERLIKFAQERLTPIDCP